MKRLFSVPIVAVLSLILVSVLFSGSVPAQSTQVTPWVVTRIGADATLNDGAGIHVYIFGTGIDVDHPDLAGNLGNGFAPRVCTANSGPVKKRAKDKCKTDWDDDNGHGTAHAGTVAALDNDFGVVGVAPGVTLHAVKVIFWNGRISDSDVIEGINWVTSETIARGSPSVVVFPINGPGGTSNTNPGICTDTEYIGTNAYDEAFCNAKNAGVVIVAWAGGAGNDAETSKPAGFDDRVITTTGTTPNDDFVATSNWGDNVAAWTTNASAPIAIAGPGASRLTTEVGGGYFTTGSNGTGTSAGAGAVALFLALNPQNADASAFHNTRAALLAAAEETAGFFGNPGGFPHNEDFLDVRSFVPVCGDGSCVGEDQCSCASDCGTPPASEAGVCSDQTDNDCDGFADCADMDCETDPFCQQNPCGNGTCDAGEDCNSCAADCDGRQSGKPANRFCCGDGVQQNAEGNGSICDGNY